VQKKMLNRQLNYSSS